MTHGGAALIFIVIVLSMIIHAMMYGPQAALIGESFPTHLRYGGAGLGYQLASVFAGGPAPLVATWLLHETGTPYSISVYIVIAAVITVVCCVALPTVPGSTSMTRRSTAVPDSATCQSDQRVAAP